MSKRVHLKWPPRVKADSADWAWVGQGEGARRVKVKELKPGGKAMKKAWGKALCRTHGAACKVPAKKLKLTSRGLSCIGI